MITKKIGGRTEYTESVRHCCGHTIDYVTLGYKMNRRQGFAIHANFTSAMN